MFLNEIFSFDNNILKLNADLYFNSSDKIKLALTLTDCRGLDNENRGNPVS